MKIHMNKIWDCFYLQIEFFAWLRSAERGGWTGVSEERLLTHPVVPLGRGWLDIPMEFSPFSVAYKINYMLGKFQG